MRCRPPRNHLAHRACGLAWPAVFAYVIVLAVLSAATSAQQIQLTPDRPTAMYSLGETVGWTVTVTDSKEASASNVRCSYTIKKNNAELLKSGNLDFASGKARIELQLNEPAMIYVEVRLADDDDKNAKPIIAAAAVAPDELKPVAPRPADFDDFWAAKIAELNKIPPNAVVEPSESDVPNVDYATITLDSIHNTHVRGQLAKPAGHKKLPAIVIFQWASPPYPLQKQWVTSRAAQGWLALNVEPHDVLPTELQSYYDALPDKLKHYETIGNNNRDESYFLRMYLGDYRAIDYITEHPDWDGKTLVLYGVSMGGQQGLCLAGLNPKATHLIVNVPAGCDTNGPLHGRQASYPNFPASDAQVMRTALYFDAVNFAPRIQAHSLIALGFVDTTCAPAGIWTAYNLISSPKEIVPMPDSPHNHLATAEQQRPFNERSAAWLDALVKGEPIPAADKVEAIPRTDANSKVAHEQLIQKAKQGGIDLYFVGDSITRRWGCTDPQYAELHENWKANFFGWNAANFGWGADTTQNILWRLQNGELDGVNPKVIVLLAGTNDVAAMPNDSTAAATITRHLERIVDLCREKAPQAHIILTAIFHRSDQPALNLTIRAINTKLAKLADDKQIYYIDVNPKLCGPNGQPRTGTTFDGLHPTVAGYQLWADELAPLLTKLLGPRAKTDHAPPPTGDPSATK
ncbi:MAG: acetylxylan esterase [Pirellulales bacterium]